MMPEHSHGTQPGEAGPGECLVLELVISSSQPLSGQVGPAGTPHRIPFHGWIDLMSAVHLLSANADNPPAPT
jgi:hypothetical protein